MNVKNITIIGTGNLGSRIGLQAAISGYNLIFYDITDSALNKAKVSLNHGLCPHRPSMN